jgi:hypothetical protein
MVALAFASEFTHSSFHLVVKSAHVQTATERSAASLRFVVEPENVMERESLVHIGVSFIAL